MYGLHQLGERTWYMDGFTNIGVYVTDNRATLIDGGSDSTAAESILAHARERGWVIDRVLCTHAHGDHTGGCAVIRAETGAVVYAAGEDAQVIQAPAVAPACLYGGRPMAAMLSKYTYPPVCECVVLTETALPQGMEMLRTDGHSVAHTAFRTADGVWFMGDSVIGEESLRRHKPSFLYDVGKHLDTLDRVAELEGEVFLPSHCEPVTDIRSLARYNRSCVMEVGDFIVEVCGGEVFPTADDVLAAVLEHFSVRPSLLQYTMVGSTVRSYLSWLAENGRIEPRFEGTKPVWVKKF